MFLNLLDTVADAPATGDAAAGAAEASSKGINWSAVLDAVVDWITHTGIKLLIAIVLMIIDRKSVV